MITEPVVNDDLQHSKALKLGRWSEGRSCVDIFFWCIPCWVERVREGGRVADIPVVI